MQYRFTWLAAILTFVFLIPGEVVGHILAYLYRLLVSGWVFGGDTVFDLFTHGWFSRVGLEGVSGGMQGLAAGLLAALGAGFAVREVFREAVLAGFAADFLAAFWVALASTAPIAARMRPISRVTCSMVIMPSTVSSLRRSE